MKRFLSVLVLVLVITNTSLGTVSHATMEASDYLSSYCVYITKSGNTISINYEVEGTGKMDCIGVTQIYLYERINNNSSWSHVQTYLSTDPAYASIMLDTNTSFAMDSVDYSGHSSYQYMAYVTVYAEKNGGSDSRNLIVYS